MEWFPIDTAPKNGKMFVAIAANVAGVGSGPYTSDPWCVWVDKEGYFCRWPHEKFLPTHWMPLPEPPKE